MPRTHDPIERLRDLSARTFTENEHQMHHQLLDETRAERDRYKAALERIADPDDMDAGWQMMRRVAVKVLEGEA